MAHCGIGNVSPVSRLSIPNLLNGETGCRLSALPSFRELEGRLAEQRRYLNGTLDKEACAAVLVNGFGVNKDDDGSERNRFGEWKAMKMKSPIRVLDEVRTLNGLCSIVENPSLSPVISHQSSSPLYFRLPERRCHNCSTTKTPSWRRCPESGQFLCNACGLYKRLHNRRRIFRQTRGGGTRAFHPSHLVTERRCRRCGVEETPAWRKGKMGLLCNACALFEKAHGKPRPWLHEDKSQ